MAASFKPCAKCPSPAKCKSAGKCMAQGAKKYMKGGMVKKGK